MTGRPWLDVVVAVGAGLLLLWAALIVALWATRPHGSLVNESMRLVPDLLRLLGRLVRDRSLARGVRIRVWLLLGYLALPIDLVPDFIPVLGYADDVVVIAIVLRSVVRRAGADAIDRHWPGSPDGLAAVHRLARTTPTTAAPGA
ncbi:MULTISPECIES: YkvA family protein [Nocardioides]|uniref:YkvA family protein n=1 Tax=Nocardioides vastitatis TaxID=2568655 RepID=A0ABW0ZH92_9ACTN|nr:YkvA family protein [Nocardioides sp.]THJ04161.1 DUF1232 domain-containing protein [Nocardioides sp.]